VKVKIDRQCDQVSRRQAMSNSVIEGLIIPILPLN
jgi:hypothetical protein